MESRSTLRLLEDVIARCDNWAPLSGEKSWT
jgi:hypothetical protein